jgi:methyltransferase
VLFLFLSTVLVLMIGETVLSRAHEHALRARGAIEPPDDVYPIMKVAYPGAFLLMGVEGLWRGEAPAAVLVAGLIVFVTAKAVKYWAMASLGPLWSFRVLVLAGEPLVESGPYRLLRHPNYLGVMGELTGAGLVMWAPVSGTAALAAFAWILRRRVMVEERALGIRLSR